MSSKQGCLIVPCQQRLSHSGQDVQESDQKEGVYFLYFQHPNIDTFQILFSTRTHFALTKNHFRQNTHTKKEKKEHCLKR